MSEKIYWKSENQLKDTELFKEFSNKEFTEEIPVDEFLANQNVISNSNITRRDFLKYLGFSTAVVSLASCKGKVNKVIPYVVKPENVTPGEAEYFATTIDNGEDFASVLVKTREGRPIKIEPNKDATYNLTNARVQASILSLYDENRLQNPKKKSENYSWENIDKEIISKLRDISKEEKEIVILSHSINSPSLLDIISNFKKNYNDVSFIEYDTFGNTSMIDAYEELTGKRGLPYYDLSKAKNIVSIGADFLGGFYNSFLRKGYSESRNPNQKQMSRHIQIESLMTISGANSDQRIAVKPSEQKKILLKLISYITGNDKISKGNTSIDDKLSVIASEIRTNISESVILCDIDDKNIQKLVMEFNSSLDTSIFNLDKTIYINKGNNRELNNIIKKAHEGKIGAIILNDLNIIQNSYLSSEFLDCLKNIDLKIQLTQREDETSEYFDYILPLNNQLESWGDSKPVEGFYSLSQPVIQKIFDTRQLSEIFLVWQGKNESSYNYLKNYWIESISNNWNKSLHDGFFETKKVNSFKPKFEGFENLSSKIKIEDSRGIELTLYKKESIGNGSLANNPWLQELPDPITRTTWDNYITINKSQANELGLKNWHESDGALHGDLVSITLNNIKIENVPILIQPGQVYGSIGLAVGYGRNTSSIKKEMKVGVNAYPLMIENDRNQIDIKIEKMPGYHKFSCIQLHNTMMGRDIIKETDFDTFKNESIDKWNPIEKLETHKGKQSLGKIDLWKEVDRTTGIHFNLSIDLNSCIGCAACVISCQAENNIPVVGKEEVSRSRDMHWIRIDRYYSSDTTKEDLEVLGSIDGYKKMEEPSENPEVVFQPIMCQHCNHAPCETVCPVSATSHGSEGQNQMAYNRCVGTRYCANNCPYKVRRFNWFKYYNNDKFDYTLNNDLYRMVLNPDVVVRERGVMEKCSMCIQKTQAGKLMAKKEGRKLEDRDIQVACASVCPTNAIKFGDINDEASIIFNEFNDKRKYYLLESVGTKPNVFYQTKIRNKKVKSLV